MPLPLLEGSKLERLASQLLSTRGSIQGVPSVTRWLLIFRLYMRFPDSEGPPPSVLMLSFFTVVLPFRVRIVGPIRSDFF